MKERNNTKSKIDQVQSTLPDFNVYKNQQINLKHEGECNGQVNFIPRVNIWRKHRGVPVIPGTRLTSNWRM